MWESDILIKCKVCLEKPYSVFWSVEVHIDTFRGTISCLEERLSPPCNFAGFENCGNFGSLTTQAQCPANLCNLYNKNFLFAQPTACLVYLAQIHSWKPSVTSGLLLLELAARNCQLDATFKYRIGGISHTSVALASAHWAVVKRHNLNQLSLFMACTVYSWLI